MKHPQTFAYYGSPQSGMTLLGSQSAGARFPHIPFLLRATVIALWMIPAGAYAQTSTTPVKIEKHGSDGRNASIFRGSTSGGDADLIVFSQGAGASLDTSTNIASILLDSRGGRGGEGHHGVIADTTGSMGGFSKGVNADISGRIVNRNAGGAAHGVSVSAAGGDAGSRMKGGDGGGNAGLMVVTAKGLTISTASSSAAALELKSRGGQGNTAYQAVGIRWSGSNGGNGGIVNLRSFSGNISAGGRGIDMSSKGGDGGNIDGGFIQTSGNHGGTGGQGGLVTATLTGLSGGGASEITTRGVNGHGLRLSSQGGDGGRITGSSWSNGADGGSGGAGGNLIADLNNVTITTSGTGARGVLAESDGGDGFWGGGSGLARGGKAGSGGDGGKIDVKLGSNVRINTTGDTATAVQAVSRGGGGSNGGEGGVFYSPGGDGSSGGTGGAVSLSSAATIDTRGKDAYGLYAASLGGASGNGGKGAGIYAVGGQGGANSHSSTVALRNSGTVSTRGEASHGLFAESIGGDGGAYYGLGQAAMGGDSRSNSPNANGSEVVVVNSGSVAVQGKSAKGILAQSIGAGGGNGGSSTGLISIGGDGHSSGNGNTVNVENTGKITTQGEQGYAIHVQSIGGGGGSGAKSEAFGLVYNLSTGGKGAAAGNGGTATINLGKSSDITTSGADASAVVAQSIGGGGGDGGIATSVGFANVMINSVGGSAGAGGHGGRVQINTDGGITTQGAGAVGVLGQSVGGGGGIGGNGTSAGLALVSIGVGGAGGSSGRGGEVSFTNRAQINTAGNDSHGALLQSVGGGGGAGGNAVAIAMSAYPQYSGSAAVSVGGTGGSGGQGGGVQSNNFSSITTKGEGAKALVAQSIGGGGGTAGTASAFSFSASLGTTVSLAIAIGRSGGDGGTGGTVSVDNQGVLKTAGEHATGLLAQSIGGGGGVGGAATSRAVAYGAQSFSGALSIGGEGGTGGNGDTVTVKQQGRIETASNAAIGVAAQSIGGGGGNGGLTHGDTRADTVNLALVLGRKGGDGGEGGRVTVTQLGQATIETRGIASDGIVAQSIGGGGGIGSSLGDKNMPPWPEPMPIPGGGGYEYEGYSGSLTIALGGAGGSGGSGNAVTVTQDGGITTHGRQSNGLVAQSIGGGGGRSGSSSSSAPGGDLSLSLNLGAKAGSGGNGGAVKVSQNGVIQTLGRDSIGLLAQSIGGGGGNASSSEAGQSAGKIGVNIAIGGSGGNAGQGGSVEVTQTGEISTKNGDVLVAQSIGGGGGLAGTVNAGLSVDGMADIISGNAPTQGGAFTLAVGGRGGAGGNGERVRVDNSGTLLADGAIHAGALLQSIGGGGGMGGMASSSYETSTIAPTSTVQVSMAVGGKGGSGGNGGAVTWMQNDTGIVQASGLLGDGVRLQSIGGGGGVAGGVAVGVSESPSEQKVRIDAALISLNGASGTGGNGGVVNAENSAGSRIVTLGDGGIGMVMQSIGGGGGLSYSVYPQGIQTATVNLGGGKGDGGVVSLIQNGAIDTQGKAAHGILAQSIGGGGGASRLIGAGNVVTQFNTAATANGNGGQVDITIDDKGRVTTRGAGAYGILAQSIGGGGGYAWSGVNTAPAAGTISQSKAGTGNGGAVTVRVQGAVHTTGENAPAVFAQSIGGGGGWVDGVAGQGTVAGQGSGGPVAVVVDGSVQASGDDASGIFAQSRGATAGAITIDVRDGGTVLGGSGNAAALELAGGKDNRVDIREGASVSAASGIAIRALTGDASTTVENRGTLQGSILLEQNVPGVLNNLGTLQAGELIALTAGDLHTTTPGQFTNRGILAIGSGNAMAATLLKGNYRQESSGSYEPKVDFQLGTGDVLTTTGSAYLDGKLAVEGRNHLPGQVVNVLQAQSGLTLAQGFYSQGNAVFDYPIVREGNNLSVGINADFTRHNHLLSDEESEVAEYLGRKWDGIKTRVAANQGARSVMTQALSADDAPAEENTTRLMRGADLAPVARASASSVVTTQADSASAVSAASNHPGQAYASVFDTVAQADDPQAYADVLEEIANDAIQAPAAIMPLAHRMFLNRTMNCPDAAMAIGTTEERSCLWGDIQGNWLDRRAGPDDSGFDYNSVRYMVGGQQFLGNGWFAGGGVSYETANGKATSTPLRTSGHSTSGVAFLRKINGPWSYAGALSAGYGSYDTHRAVSTINGIERPYADWNTSFAALRLQASYVHQMADMYIKPTMDVDLIYQRVPSYSEKGGGAFNLAFDGHSDVRAMISPSVEFGGRFEKNDLALRPYVGLGVNWMPGNDWNTSARLKIDNSGDRFHLTQELPSVFAEYRLGMDIETREGMVLRAEWRQRLGDRYNDRSAQLQLGMRF
ncbi:Autotransporter domain-containing protein [Bordetella tumbae]